MENINFAAIPVLLGYYLSLGFLARWCCKKNYSAKTGFALAALSCVVIAALYIGTSSIYHSKNMLVNESIALTVLLFAVLALVGGWRCVGYMKGYKPEKKA